LSLLPKPEPGRRSGEQEGGKIAVAVVRVNQGDA